MAIIGWGRGCSRANSTRSCFSPLSSLATTGMPDIGQLFPDNDPKWKGADSATFMREATR